MPSNQSIHSFSRREVRKQTEPKRHRYAAFLTCQRRNANQSIENNQTLSVHAQPIVGPNMLSSFHLSLFMTTTTQVTCRPRYAKSLVSVTRRKERRLSSTQPSPAQRSFSIQRVKESKLEREKWRGYLCFCCGSSFPVNGDNQPGHSLDLVPWVPFAVNFARVIYIACVTCLPAASA